MAIFHLTVKTVSRGIASAKARYDYIERSGHYASDRKEVVYSQSGNMPEWSALDAKKYWDAADIFERENGRLFKQLEFALPKELTPQQQKELVQGYVKTLTLTKDGHLPYSFAIHKGHKKENPHCHLMISERALDGYQRTAETWFKRANNKKPEQGGAKKSEALKSQDWLLEIRKEWSCQANQALELAGHQAKIDHRSLKAQGINREPTQHLGPAVAAMERKGVTTDRGQRNQQIVKNNQMTQELAEAKSLKEKINEGINLAGQRFQAEKIRRQREFKQKQEAIKERQLKEIERQKYEEQQRQLAEQERIAREKEQKRQAERERREKIERQRQEQRKQRTKGGWER